MINHYIDTIEQAVAKDGGINEYGAREKVAGDYETVVLPKFYKKLSDVSADIGKNHYFMDIRIVDSDGGVVKKDKVGKRKDPDAKPEAQDEADS